jgi:hypothetical protein
MGTYIVCTTVIAIGIEKMAVRLLSTVTSPKKGKAGHFRGLPKPGTPAFKLHV